MYSLLWCFALNNFDPIHDGKQAYIIIFAQKTVFLEQNLREILDNKRKDLFLFTEFEMRAVVSGETRKPRQELQILGATNTKYNDAKIWEPCLSCESWLILCQLVPLIHDLSVS